MTQVSFYESPIFKECLVMVSKAMQLLATLTLDIFVKRGTIVYQNWNFFSFLCHPWCVSCLSSQEIFTNNPSISWPWDTRSSWRSIFLDLFPLSFSAVEQQSRRKEMKHHDAVDQPLQERRSLWDQQDRWRLVWTLFSSLLYYLRISGRDSCKGDRSVTSLFC
jgi:hypothetical protein